MFYLPRRACAIKGTKSVKDTINVVHGKDRSVTNGDNVRAKKAFSKDGKTVVQGWGVNAADISTKELIAAIEAETEGMNVNLGDGQKRGGINLKTKFSLA